MEPRFVQALMQFLPGVGMNGLARSKGAARTLIAQGGLYVNDERWADPEKPLSAEQALFGRAMLLRSGKHNYHLLLADED